MKIAIVASLLIAGASAFVPAAKTTSSTTVLNAANQFTSKYSNELGVISPTGFFDPFGLSKKIDQATFDKYRLAELKHGRVAQLAVLGYVTQECVRFPGEIAYGVKFADMPNGLDAIAAVPALGWAQIFVAIGAIEINDKSKGGVFALGDFEVGKPDLNPEMLNKRKLQELQNGRLAMLAIAELYRHDSANGADGLDNLITGLPFLYN